LGGGGSPWHEWHPVMVAATGDGMSARRAAVKQRRLPNGVGPPTIVHFLFKLIQSKGFLPLHKIFQTKYGRVDNLIRNKSPHWSFSKSQLEFELKFGKLI
jgi:hypothetical protein